MGWEFVNNELGLTHVECQEMMGRSRDSCADTCREILSNENDWNQGKEKISETQEPEV